MKCVRTFATGLSIALFSALLSYLVFQSPAATRPTTLSTFPIGMPVEKFPILPRFEVPRNYGFFIGDQIPLRLIIETTGDVVVNLENLPQKGQKHGPFEITDMQIGRQTAPGSGAIYQVTYALQYFGPTPLTATFKGVEIRYTRATNRHPPRQALPYKRLVTQPVPIHMSRLSPLHGTASRRPKGAIQDQRTMTVWLGGIFATICLAAGSVLGVKARQQQRQQRNPGKTLPMLPEEQEVHLPLYDLSTSHARSPEHAALMQRLRHTLDAHIQAVYGLPAAALSSAEIAEQLPNHPDARDIMWILERCDTLPAQSSDPPYEDEQGLCWDAAAYCEQRQQVKTT